MKSFHDVLAFHYRFGVRTPSADKPHMPAKDVLKFRTDFLQEELDEFKRAVENNDLPGALDALIDLNYVSYGTAILMGITPQCWTDAWDEVQRANMEKVRAPNADASKRSHELDVVKPSSWRPPRLRTVLMNHGWNPHDD